MTSLKLFRIGDTKVKELESRSSAIEKSLQTLIEKNLQTMLGIRFVASEYPIRKDLRSKIDTIGVDENASPVIIKYKRASNENILSQGLYYLDWLAEHRPDFQRLVVQRLGRDAGEAIQWNNPRLVLIAGDFSRFDKYAADQLGRHIELVRYRQFDIGFLLLELAYVTKATPTTVSREEFAEADSTSSSVTELLEQSDRQLFDLYQSLAYFLEALGDDVHKTTYATHFAFRRLKNFVCVVPDPDIKGYRLYLDLEVDQIRLEKGFTEDVRESVHAGSGDVEILIRSEDDLEHAKALLTQSYATN
jgi:predicted transport protein